MKVYFNSLPPDKVPIQGTEGETYRRQQFTEQLPFFDIDIKSSINNERTEEERKLFLAFIQERRERYRGRGEVKMRGASDLSLLWVSLFIHNIFGDTLYIVEYNIIFVAMP